MRRYRSPRWASAAVQRGGRLTSAYARRLSAGRRRAVSRFGRARAVAANDDRLLGDVTVLDLSRDISGAFCTKLLAALGARVVKVEPPAGGVLRARGPFKDDVPNSEGSG